MTPKEIATLDRIKHALEARVARGVLTAIAQMEPVAPAVFNDVKPSDVRVVNEVETPAVHVVNQVQPTQVVVHVDMAPVASALDRLGDMFGQLVAALTELPPPEVKVDVSAPSVNVQAPNVTVEPPIRMRRKFTVKHSDGSTTQVTED